MKLKHVYQLDDTGCGLAAVAIIANQSYRDVRKVTLSKGIVKNEKCFGTNYADIKRLLKCYKIKFNNQRKFKRWIDIPSTSIVSTNFSKDGCWHWVVFAKRGNNAFIYDPGRKEKKRIKEFRGRNTGKYIEVFQ